MQYGGPVCVCHQCQCMCSHAARTRLCVLIARGTRRHSATSPEASGVSPVQTSTVPVQCRYSARSGQCCLPLLFCLSSSRAQALPYFVGITPGMHTCTVWCIMRASALKQIKFIFRAVSAAPCRSVTRSCCRLCIPYAASSAHAGCRRLPPLPGKRRWYRCPWYRCRWYRCRWYRCMP